MPSRIVSQYADLRDEELACRFQEGDLDALTALLDRYRAIMRSKARVYFVEGAGPEDVEQEAMIGLYKSARDFRSDRGVPFRAFAELCVNRQIASAIRVATRRKHQPLNRSVPFPSCAAVEIEGSRAWHAADFAVHAADPAETVMSRERLERMRASMAEVLSGLEADVLRLYVEGQSYQEIGLYLGRHAKSIDNALRRIKRKLDGPRAGDWAYGRATMAG